jgi:hypothetical protein
MNTYIDKILTASDGYVSGLRSGACSGITVQNSIGCNGLCDTRIHEILQVDQAWLGATPIVGVLYDIATFDFEMYNSLGRMLHQMKIQERNISEQVPKSYPTANQWSDSDQVELKRWGEGTRLYDFFRVYWFSMVNFAGSPENAPTAPFPNLGFSSTVGYNASSESAFMSEEKVRQGTAYWMIGQSDAHSVSTHAVFMNTGYKTQFSYPTGIAIDKAQRLYVSDSGNVRILRIQNIWHANKFSETVAGIGYSTFGGNGKLALETSLVYPRGLSFDPQGVLYFADTKAHDIRQILGLTWNDPCKLSGTYFAKLANPTAGDVTSAGNLLDCRLRQVRSLMISRVNLCGKCHAQVKERVEFTVPSSYRMNMDLASGECSRSFITSICNTELEPKSTPASMALSDSLKEIGGCASCPQEFGCELAEADDVWNATLNDTSEGADTPYEKTFYLSEGAIKLASDAIATLSSYKQSEQALSTWAGFLTAEMNACINADGKVALDAAIQALKTKLCETGASANVFIAKMYFDHWLAYISDVCLEVIDNPMVDQEALLGAQYYNKMSQMVTGLFWHAYNAVLDTWTPSSCHSKCDLTHPRFFLADAWKQIPYKERLYFSGDVSDQGAPVSRLPKKRGMFPADTTHDNWRCCGIKNNGVLCGIGEGPCELNSDCASGLVCGKGNCLWSPSQNCCATMDDKTASDRMNDFARSIGYHGLVDMWSYTR